MNDFRLRIRRKTLTAITLYQPYAHLIVRGIKTKETRSWSTAHRGPLLIHAAKKIPNDVADRFRFDEKYRKILAAAGLSWDRLMHGRGRILGGVILAGIRRTNDLSVCPEFYGGDLDRQSDLFDIPIREGMLGNFGPNRFAWSLTAPREFGRQPAARGKQGLWKYEVPPELSADPFFTVGEALDDIRQDPRL